MSAVKPVSSVLLLLFAAPPLGPPCIVSGDKRVIAVRARIQSRAEVLISLRDPSHFAPSSHGQAAPRLLAAPSRRLAEQLKRSSAGTRASWAEISPSWSAFGVSVQCACVEHAWTSSKLSLCRTAVGGLCASPLHSRRSKNLQSVVIFVSQGHTFDCCPARHCSSHFIARPIL